MKRIREHTRVLTDISDVMTVQLGEQASNEVIQHLLDNISRGQGGIATWWTQALQIAALDETIMEGLDNALDRH